MIGLKKDTIKDPVPSRSTLVVCGDQPHTIQAPATSWLVGHVGVTLAKLGSELSIHVTSVTKAVHKRGRRGRRSSSTALAVQVYRRKGTTESPLMGRLHNGMAQTGKLASRWPAREKAP